MWQPDDETFDFYFGDDDYGDEFDDYEDEYQDEYEDYADYLDDYVEYDFPDDEVVF